jgi:hypothetical protein
MHPRKRNNAGLMRQQAHRLDLYRSFKMNRGADCQLAYFCMTESVSNDEDVAMLPVGIGDVSEA